MLAIERSERASITTGKAKQKNVAEGDPLDGMGFGVAFSDEMDGLRNQGCLPLHSLRSFRWQVPLVTQMTPSGCFARINKCPYLLHHKRYLPNNNEIKTFVNYSWLFVLFHSLAVKHECPRMNHK